MKEGKTEGRIKMMKRGNHEGRGRDEGRKEGRKNLLLMVLPEQLRRPPPTDAAADGRRLLAKGVGRVPLLVLHELKLRRQ